MIGVLLIMMLFQHPDHPLRDVLAQPEKRRLIGAYWSGELSLEQFKTRAQALRPRRPIRPMKDAPTLDDVYIPGVLLQDFYGNDDLCAGPQRPVFHPYSIPSMFSLTYRRLTYDPSGESWGGEDLGIKGDDAVGVIYQGWVQRIWGHGFSVELETDPIQGVIQRVELVHFEEQDCLPGPQVLPCIVPVALYGFTWNVNDNSYQVRKAHVNWQMAAQMMDFYRPDRYAMVAGTPCLELRTLEGLDAGFATGRTRVWQTALPFFWAPCADFIYADFYARTQFRGNPWPGLGTPLMMITEAKPTEKQRSRTRDDLEAARSQPTEMDEASGVDTRVLGANRHDNLLDSESFSKEMARRLDRRIRPYQERLKALGEAFPDSYLSAFARFALRELNNSDVFFLYDMHLLERQAQFRAVFPRWAREWVAERSDLGFTHHVAQEMEIDWDPPWQSQRYATVLNHPLTIIPLLRSSDEEIRDQGDLVSALIPTTELIHENTDPNLPSEWPNFGWPNTLNPDTYWSIYVTWR